MEFKYRAIDQRPTPTPTPTQISYLPPPSRPPPSTIPTVMFFSERPLRGGFSIMVPNPVPNGFRMAANNAIAGGALPPEMEKTQIRRVAIAEAVRRRMELEGEVRRELAALEREMGIASMQRNLGGALALAPPRPPPPPPLPVLSFEDRVARRLDPGVSPFQSIFAMPKPQPPKLMAPVEIKPSEETNNKDKVIVLAKPNLDLHGTKRKAITLPFVDGFEHSSFGIKKRPKEEWSCALCQFSATNKRGLNEHLLGLEHQAKAAALRQKKTDKSINTSPSSKKSKMSVESTEAINRTSWWDAKPDRSLLRIRTTGGDIDPIMVDEGVVEPKYEEQLVQNSQNIEGLKNENGTTTVTDHEEVGGRNALKRKEFKFWCEFCQVGACNEVVMESHMKGKKHLNRIKIFGPDPARSSSSLSQQSPMLTKETDQKITANWGKCSSSSVSQDAPMFIKDTYVVNKEIDQKMTANWVKFTVVEWQNQVENMGEGL